MNTVNTDKQVEELVCHLYSSRRTKPVLVITTNIARTGPVLSLYRAQELLTGLARVFWVTGLGHRHFNRALANIYGIEPSGARLYLPNMKAHDHLMRHTLWMENRIAEFEDQDHFLGQVADNLRARLQHAEKPSKGGLARQVEELFGTPEISAVRPPRASTRPVLSLR